MANKYTEAAYTILDEIGGGPIRSGDLVKRIKEREMVEFGKYTYHYILKSVKDDPRFDTSQRGRVGLVAGGQVAAQEVVEEAPAPDADENPAGDTNELPDPVTHSAFGDRF